MQIRALVEKSGIPFLPMSMAKGLLPDTHPQCAGAARSTVLKDSDVVMLIGARLNWLLSHGKGKTWGEPGSKKFIQIDIEPKEMDCNVEIVAPLVGDIGSCVSALLDGMGGNWPAPPADWIDAVKAKQRREHRQDGAEADEEHRRRWTSTARSARCAPSSKSGRTPSSSTKAPTRSISRAASSTCISRASAWTSAPGASWASAWASPSPPPIETGKPVLAVEGDSAFGFSGMEVETICRYNLPVCIVVFNNNGIYRGTDVNPTGGSDPATTVFVKDSRYDKMMEAFGGVGVNATTPDELQARRQRGHGLRQADPHQRGDRPGGRQRERQHRQPQPAKRAEEEMNDGRRCGDVRDGSRARSVRKVNQHAGRMGREREMTTNGEARMGKALEGVRILDFTHVQSGPTCTQLLAWFGADVIKVERPGEGDITRGQLRDIPKADSLYFTMLNHNKRSITIDTKNKKGKEILERLVKKCDVLVENFAPGALDRMGSPGSASSELNPRMIFASVKGFGPGPYEDCKVYENVAQCTGGSASTTGFRDGPPLVTGAQIGDSGTGLHLALGIVTALYQRTMTGKGQRVTCAMQDGVLNLCRVKMRDQQRLAHGPLTEYSQYGEGIPFGEAVPRAGNDSGGGQPGRILKCKGWETDPNAYIYFITQAPVWEAICDVIGEPGWKTHPDYAKPPARLPRLNEIFGRIEEWTMTKTKFEAMEILNKYDIPCGPILSMKELAEDPSLRATGTMVEVDHPTRGKYLSVGNPIKLSASRRPR